MGYTNYWRRPVELNAEHFAAAVRDVKLVLEKASIAVAGFDGKCLPVLDDEHIVFNGLAPNCCEPLEIARVEFDRRGHDVVRSFCKTGHLPYDLAVKLALIVFCHHTAGFQARCDGRDGDWDAARSAAQEYLGYGSAFRPASD